MPITRPKGGPLSQSCRCNQMGINVTDAMAKQPPLVDDIQHFMVCSDSRLRQVEEVAENQTSRLQVTQGKFSNDERMPQNLSGFEQLCQGRIASSQVIHPD